MPARLLDRRGFLRAAGVTFALPWLEAGDPPAAAAKPPARAVFMFIPNGANMWRWHPPKVGPLADLGPTLASLAPYAKELTVFSGLEHVKGLGGHNEPRIFLTGNPDPGPSSVPRDSAISVDQHIAQAIGGQTRLPSLALSPIGGNQSISFDARGRIVNAENNLRRLYGELFGSPDVLAQIDRRRSVLDLVGAQTRALDQQLGLADRRRLADYADSVRDIERRLQADRGYFTSRPLAEAPDDLPFDADPIARRRDYVDGMLAILALALRAGHTRIATVCGAWSGTSPYNNFAEVGCPQWHGYGHEVGGSAESEKPEKWAGLAGIDRWWAERLAGFLGRLAAIDEGGVSLLARTMVMYGYGMSWASFHSATNLPMLLAGGSALGLRHGNHVRLNPHLGDLIAKRSDYRGDQQGKDQRKTTVSDLLRTISERMGVPAAGFAGSRRVIDEIVA